MTPEWVIQLVWFTAALGATGAFWYFLSQREFHAAIWVGFATGVLVLLAIALHLRNAVITRNEQAEANRRNESAAAAQVASSYEGPYPPFSLGGSLEETLFRDVYLANRDWRPVARNQDVEIDWRGFSTTALVVDATVKGRHGFCFLGVWDVGNNVVVSQSDAIEVNMSGTEVTIPIPHETGRKTYRLVTRGSDGTATALFGAVGEINFPSYSLGGTKTLATPGAATDWRSVGNARDVEINWTQIRPPVNKVLVDAELLVSDYIRGEATVPPVGRARVRLRNLADNTVAAETGWIEAGRRSMHHSYWPGKATLRQQLMRVDGIAQYRLEVMTSGPVVAATAYGKLTLRH